MTKGKTMLKKNLVILTRPSNKSFQEKIKEAAAEKSLNVFIIYPENIDLPLDLHLKNHQQHLPIPESCLFWNRISGTTYNDYDRLITASWQQMGATLLNCPNVHHLYRDKFRQYLHLKNAGLPVLNTYYLPNKNTKNIPHEGPFVAKTLRGAKGKGVIKLIDKMALEDFLTLTESMGDTRFIIQDFVSYEQEHRLLVCGGEIIRHLIKTSSGGHWKHNLNNSKWSVALETPEEMINIVKKVDALEKKFFYAVDLIYKNNDLYLLEVNICPGVDGPDELSEKSILHEVLDII